MLSTDQAADLAQTTRKPQTMVTLLISSTSVSLSNSASIEKDGKILTTQQP